MPNSGGACPATNILPGEGEWLLAKCRAAGLLVASDQTKLASQILGATPARCCLIPIHYALDESFTAVPYITDEISFPPAQPGLLLFTSGTTGPPKVYRPVNGLSGVLNLMDLIYVGARAELFPGGIQAQPIWERLGQGGVTVLAGATRFWSVLRSYYEESLRSLPTSELSKYDEGVHNLRVVWFGGGMPLLRSGSG
ncbi:hypothetical protein EYZ11_011637 [Aspergillus tanneri]|uniref:AMP-dependent synthetase/ligase domain-containing protein n=1 Tax=Aspergillus tanneri TaxID=1220188 RepID=A0A4S3J2A8_9EURO|nr:hypothetical protein EYZ11_011637 [Aspergillus tanneri]